VRKADVIHNNMRVGAMDRLGMGVEELRALNPRLIYCHSSGYFYGILSRGRSAF